MSHPISLPSAIIFAIFPTLLRQLRAFHKGASAHHRNRPQQVPSPACGGMCRMRLGATPIKRKAPAPRAAFPRKREKNSPPHPKRSATPPTSHDVRRFLSGHLHSSKRYGTYVSRDTAPQLSSLTSHSSALRRSTMTYGSTSWVLVCLFISSSTTAA